MDMVWLLSPFVVPRMFVSRLHGSPPTWNRSTRQAAGFAPVATGRNPAAGNAAAIKYAMHPPVARRTSNPSVSKTSSELPAPQAPRFAIAGTAVAAQPSDSYAAAAWLAGQRVLSRSLKYHRPRGAFCFEGHCSGCLVRINGVPNLRACQAACRDGASLETQNAFPTAGFDVLGAVDHVYRHGMDHHTLMTSATVLNKVANRVVRALSGLGTLPSVTMTSNDATTGQPVVHVDIDVAIVGAGPSGLAAAAAIAQAGHSVVVVDQQLELGGSYLADVRFGRAAASAAIAAAQHAGASLLAQTTVIGYFAEPGNIRQGVMIASHGAGHGRWHETTLLRIHAQRWVWATVSSGPVTPSGPKVTTTSGRAASKNADTSCTSRSWPITATFPSS